MRCKIYVFTVSVPKDQPAKIYQMLLAWLLDETKICLMHNEHPNDLCTFRYVICPTLFKSTKACYEQERIHPSYYIGVVYYEYIPIILHISYYEKEPKMENIY